MAISIEEKKRSIKDKRSRAIQQKINLLRARDGSDAPKIDSSTDEDDFNLNQFYGGSKSSNIDWTQMGVEGLIRCYYEIIYKIDGTKRNNLITNNTETPNGNAWSSNSYKRSDFTTTAKQALAGTAYKSGFFVGNDEGFEGLPVSSDSINAKAARGEYDITSSTFSHNRDKIYINGSYNYPPNDNGLLIDKLNDVINLIGNKSSLGPHTGTIPYGTPTPSYTDFIEDSILGNRFTDVIQAVINPPGSIFVPDGEGGGSSETYDGSYSFGNGQYDFETNTSISQDQAQYSSSDLPPDYQFIHRDYYDNNLDTLLNDIKNKLNDIIQFINYTKVDYDNYFMNSHVIPGRDTNWDIQNTWINKINDIITKINTYLTNKSSASRLTLDQLLIQLKSDINEFKNYSINMKNDITNLFGDPLDSSTLYGFRLLWIKNLIDIQNGGSKITLMSISNSIEDADKKIAQSEESYGLIGVQLLQDLNFSSQKYWKEGIVTPIIGGIESHLTLDQNEFLDDGSDNPNYFTMIPDGLIIAWEEVAHATAYNVYKSLDYDPNTGQGTWTPLIPNGQTYTVENIDINTGKVLSYYIDYDINFEAEEDPYYKVKVFDVGKKSTNNYWWYGATSDYSEPMRMSDFIATPSSGTNIPGMSGPPPAKPDELPDYLFKYATIKMGGEASDAPVNKTYTSDVEFDSIGSNLEVFVDGVLINQGTNDNEYQVINNTDIEFNLPINSNSKVTMIVYFGESGSGTWKTPVATFDQLPTSDNINGDVILVLDTNKLYSWDSIENNWYEISGANISSHTDLLDMPDTNGMNADHDMRYPRREELDDIKSDLQSQLNLLKFLIPENALPLSSELTITNTNYYTGYLSGGTFNNFVTLTKYQQFNKILIGDIFTFESINKDLEFTDADKGILSLYLNDQLIDSIDLENKFIEDDRNTQQSWTPFNSTNIEIDSIYAYNNYGQYQKCDFKININKNILIPGENKIELKHESNEFNRSTGELIFFWDSTPTNIFFADISVAEKYIGSHKYLSGVRYYSLNDSLQFEFRSQGIFDNTYVKTNQVKVISDEFGINEFSFDNTDSHTTTDGSTQVVPNVNNPMWYNNYLILNKGNVYSTKPTLKLIGYKPYCNSNIFEEQVDKMLINTYSQASDDKHEYFVDEIYRLPNGDYDNVGGNYINQWDSSVPLKNGELLQYDGKLVYPNINFGVDYKPVQILNYSGMIGEREYYRAFIDDGVPHNNGNFIIQGDIFNDENVKIMMKLPGQTGWLNLKKLYNEGDFTGIDDDGCLLEYNENSFKWTSGGFSTALSGYVIILRVVMSTSDATPIEEISINW